jgi:Ca2+-binding EF-hand superfamily protein
MKRFHSKIFKSLSDNISYYLFFMSFTDQQLQQYIDQSFNVYDRDRSGCLNKQELANFFNDVFRSAGLNRTVTYNDVENALRSIDVNNDGRTTKQELFRAFKFMLGGNQGGYGGQQGGYGGNQGGYGGQQGNFGGNQGGYGGQQGGYGGQGQQGGYGGQQGNFGGNQGGYGGQQGGYGGQQGGYGGQQGGYGGQGQQGGYGGQQGGSGW